MRLINNLKSRQKGEEVRKMFRQRGQSTLEYVIILTAIVAGVIVAATQFVQPRVQGSLDSISQKMEDKVKNIDFGN